MSPSGLFSNSAQTKSAVADDVGMRSFVRRKTRPRHLVRYGYPLEYFRLSMAQPLSAQSLAPSALIALSSSRRTRTVSLMKIKTLRPVRLFLVVLAALLAGGCFLTRGPRKTERSSSVVAYP